MAKVLTFFSRQAIVGGGLASTDLYSEIFEIPEGANLAVQFRVLMTNEETTAATGVLQHCMDPGLTPTGVWTQVGTAMAVAANPPPAFGVQTVSNLMRFVRARVTAPTLVSYVVSLDGVLRERT